MAWTNDEWAQFATLLSRGFKAADAFTDADAVTYRLLLDRVEPAAALVALQELVLAGQTFRPAPGEIVERARRDTGKPTFPEAYRLIFGPRGVLRARPAGRQWSDHGERARAEEAAALERAGQMHPLVAGFVQRQGVERLRSLELDDPEYGPVRRRELEQAWNEHVEAFDGREVAALAGGGDPRAGLRQLDPLSAVAPAAPAAALTASTSDPEEGTP